MRLGAFMMPAHPPGRDLLKAFEHDLVEIEWLDELGFDEVWIGEHLTAQWEPFPAGDLMIAQAAPRTQRIKLCAGGFVVPYYHPAALAMRAIQLDHLCQGRFMVGIAAGSVPTDMALLNLDLSKGENRELTYEALEIMLKLWTEHVGSEWEHKGKYFSVRNPSPMLLQGQPAYGPHLQPLQRPHPPIGMAALSPKSETIKVAGERGYMPLSIAFNANLLAGHWDTYEEAALSQGRTPSRDLWRVNREVFVAETDAEARQYVRDGLQAKVWSTVILPFIKGFGWVEHLKHDPSVRDEDVDIDYLMDHLWLVGSPSTVKERLSELYERLGGFGTVLMTTYDHMENPDAYRRSLELLATEVVPGLPGD